MGICFFLVPKANGRHWGPHHACRVRHELITTKQWKPTPRHSVTGTRTASNSDGWNTGCTGHRERGCPGHREDSFLLPLIRLWRQRQSPAILFPMVLLDLSLQRRMLQSQAIPRRKAFSPLCILTQKAYRSINSLFQTALLTLYREWDESTALFSRSF